MVEPCPRKILATLSDLSEAPRFNKDWCPMFEPPLSLTVGIRRHPSWEEQYFALVEVMGKDFN